MGEKSSQREPSRFLLVASAIAAAACLYPAFLVVGVMTTGERSFASAFREVPFESMFHLAAAAMPAVFVVGLLTRRTPTGRTLLYITLGVAILWYALIFFWMIPRYEFQPAP